MKSILLVLVNMDKTQAVVIWYDQKRHQAPVFLSKMKDDAVSKVTEYAQEHDICVRENELLCEALSHNCEVGTVIPEVFFAAVAEMFASAIKSDCAKADVAEKLLIELRDNFQISI